MLGSALGPTPEWWEPPAVAAHLYATAAALLATFELRACRFEPFPFDAQLPRIERGRIVLPATEPGVAPWSGDGGVELPVRFEGLTLGRFVLVPMAATSGVAFSPSDRADAIDMVAGLSAFLAAAICDGTLPPSVVCEPPARRTSGRQPSS